MRQKTGAVIDGIGVVLLLRCDPMIRIPTTFPDGLDCELEEISKAHVDFLFVVLVHVLVLVVFIGAPRSKSLISVLMQL